MALRAGPQYVAQQALPGADSEELLVGHLTATRLTPRVSQRGPHWGLEVRIRATTLLSTCYVCAQVTRTRKLTALPQAWPCKAGTTVPIATGGKTEAQRAGASWQALRGPHTTP